MAWEIEDPVEQVAVVGEVDHGLEDRLDGSGPHLVGKAGGEQVTGVVARPAYSFGELGQERVGVVVGVADDLTAEEAVLGCDVALDVDEAGDSVGVAVCQQECREPAHRVTDEVEPVDLVGLEDLLCDGDQERDGDGAEVGAGRGAAAWRVVRKDRVLCEPCVLDDVRIVLLGRAEPVEEDQWRAGAIAMEPRHLDTCLPHGEGEAERFELGVGHSRHRSAVPKSYRSSVLKPLQSCAISSAS